MKKEMGTKMNVPKGKKGIVLELPNEGFAYGVPTKSSTPIKKVINGYYGDVAEQRTIQRYEEIFRIVIYLANISHLANYPCQSKQRLPDLLQKLPGREDKIRKRRER